MHRFLGNLKTAYVLAALLAAGVSLPATLILLGCRLGVEGPVDVNVDQQNRGTITGKALVNKPYQDPSGGFVAVGGADIRLTNSSTTPSTTSYRTNSSSNGGFLIEVPASSYDVHGCYKETGSGGTRVWYGKRSATVARGSTVDMGELKLSWQSAFGCASF